MCSSLPVFLVVRLRDPRSHSVAALKRVARHLLKHPSMQFEYWLTPISEASVLEACSDSDWAGCLTTSGSMSGGVRTLAGCAVKSWSNRQDSVVLSSGEAEYYACVKAAAELMGQRIMEAHLCHDLEHVCVARNVSHRMAKRWNIRSDEVSVVCRGIVFAMLITSEV